MKLCCSHIRMFPLSLVTNSIKGSATCLHHQQKLTFWSAQPFHGLRFSHNHCNSLPSGQNSRTTSSLSNWQQLQTCRCGLYSDTCRTRIRKSGCRFYSDLKKQIEKPPWRMLFMGSDEFSLVHLKALHQNMNAEGGTIVKSLEVVAPTHRKNPVNRYCQENQLRLHAWPLPTMTGCYDVGIVSSFGHLIPDRVITMFPFGIINVHASLLPKYRGGAPLIHTILNGDKETGVSIMDIRPKRFDIGPVLMWKKCVVPPHCTTMRLQSILAHEGTTLLLRTLENLPKMKLESVEQKSVEASFAPLLDTDVGYANWKEDTVEEIVRQFNAVHEKHDFRSMYRSINVRLYNMLPLEMIEEQGILQDIVEKFNNEEVIPGQPYYHKISETLCIKCKDGWVAFRDINIKKRMTARNFYHGYLAKEKNKNFVFESRPNKLEKYMLSKSKRS